MGIVANVLNHVPVSVLEFPAKNHMRSAIPPSPDSGTMWTLCIKYGNSMGRSTGGGRSGLEGAGLLGGGRSADGGGRSAGAH